MSKKYRIYEEGSVTDLSEEYPRVHQRLLELSEDREIEGYEVVEDEDAAWKEELRQSYEDAMGDGAADTISDEALYRNFKERAGDE